MYNFSANKHSLTNQGRCPIRRTAARPISEGMINRQTIFCLFIVYFLDDFISVVLISIEQY